MKLLASLLKRELSTSPAKLLEMSLGHHKTASELYKSMCDAIIDGGRPTPNQMRDAGAAMQISEKLTQAAYNKMIPQTPTPEPEKRNDSFPAGC